ncbi:hypothetical protein VNO80_04273 [Phaseolus coccineus]|uniref:Uncharacterized protein n=1 Tax=Phaseolus coccineus TaxID=3886 RepID=A0AAN9NT45_PHACN
MGKEKRLQPEGRFRRSLEIRNEESIYYCWDSASRFSQGLIIIYVGGKAWCHRWCADIWLALVGIMGGWVDLT